ncbi:TRAP transporter substrate-binding protein [Inmirania thermothiophila]|uniref:TRAP-type C4-dicarboxylate transport system substrate-binding protein n=1 Tax=Inmirania thermothiophila TaxID=1750597 RepID=A0A3N1Y039_9GAMM|nr:TRAP transporter substrate-binding protein [Inmirania thermothiophila]ROR32196.1 TRAP-type C4-dicarboxylate transport system substrate-binding protein [Inmirania thermothiophila]
MRPIRPLALLLGLLVAVGPAGAAEVVLRLHHFLPPPSTAHSKLLKPWAERIEQASGGRIEVQIYPAMQLGGKPPQLYDQVREGVVDVVWTLTGYTPGRFPISEVFELPFMAASAKATSQAAWAFYERYMREEFRGVHPLLIHVHAPGQFHLRDRLVRRLEDLQGLKIRTPTRAMRDGLAALGATPVGMPVPQVPQALARGVIDGALLPYEVTRPLKVHELVCCHTEVGGARGLYTAVFLLAMNRQRYEALPPDLRRVIDEHSGMALAREAGEMWDRAEAPGREAARMRGNRIHALPPEEVARWEAATRPVVRAWVERMNAMGLDGEAMLREARALIERYSR